MKRKLLHAVLVASMAVALSGCGNTSGINADAEKTQKATETENIEEERGTEVAAAEQKENTTGTPMKTENICGVFQNFSVDQIISVFIWRTCCIFLLFCGSNFCASLLFNVLCFCSFLCFLRISINTRCVSTS